MASASEVFPAPALEIRTTFLSDSLCGSLMGPSSSMTLNKSARLRSHIAQKLNILKLRLASSFATVLLVGLFEHHAMIWLHRCHSPLIHTSAPWPISQP